MEYQIGTAEIDVTPPVGMRMGGFGGRTHGAVGIHDPLRSKAIAISDGDAAALIITNDILNVSYEFMDELNAEIGKRCGLAAEQVLVNTSHTHSGPLMQGIGGMGDTDSVYPAVLIQKLGGLAEMALNDMQPARVTSHTGPLQVGINRRERTEDGIILGRRPEGIVDKSVEVLRCADENGRLVAIWFAHAAHGVTLGGNNYYFSADWMGYAQRVLEQVYPDTLVAYAQGCCGNINSDPVGGTFEDARRLGTRAAGGTMMALETEGVELSGPVRCAKVSEQVPQKDPPPVAELDQQLAQHDQMLTDARAAGDVAQVQNAAALIAWAQMLRELAAAGATEHTMRFDISAVTIGQHAIVGLAGEVFFEYAVNIAERSPFERTTVLGTTNGCISYLPTAEEIPLGGYEVDSSMRYYRQLWLKPECEQVVLAEAEKLLGSLHD